MTATVDIGSQHHMGQDTVAVACLVLQQSPLIGRAGWPVKTALLGTRQGHRCEREDQSAVNETTALGQVEHVKPATISKLPARRHGLGGAAGAHRQCPASIPVSFDLERDVDSFHVVQFGGEIAQVPAAHHYGFAALPGGEPDVFLFPDLRRSGKIDAAYGKQGPAISHPERLDPLERAPEPVVEPVVHTRYPSCAAPAFNEISGTSRAESAGTP